MMFQTMPTAATPFLSASALNFGSPGPMSFSQGPLNNLGGENVGQNAMMSVPNFYNQQGGNPGSFENLGFMDKAGLALSGLQTLGGLFNAFKAQKLARDQFNFTKDVTETNMANQIKSYNTALEDRGRSRAFTEGQSSEEAKSYIDKNSLASFGS
jgi:hypothetical protein